MSIPRIPRIGTRGRSNDNMTTLSSVLKQSTLTMTCKLIVASCCHLDSLAMPCKSSFDAPIVLSVRALHLFGYLENDLTSNLDSLGMPCKSFFASIVLGVRALHLMMFAKLWSLQSFLKLTLTMTCGFIVTAVIRRATDVCVCLFWYILSSVIMHFTLQSLCPIKLYISISIQFDCSLVNSIFKGLNSSVSQCLQNVFITKLSHWH